MKVPTDKDKLIKYLMDRLDYSEQAIEEAENCITNERAKRIQLKDEMKTLNHEIGMLTFKSLNLTFIYTEKEKITLQQKVHKELEKTLNAAIQAKVKAETELKSKVNECKERDMMCQELDLQTLLMRHKTREITEKDEKLEGEALEMNTELNQLREETKNLKEENQKLNEDIEEAHTVIKKLDEARYTLNRLLGPNGVLSERERKKFLKQRGDEEYDIGGQEDGNFGNNGANAGGGVGSVSRNMLGSNNDYFYNDQPKQEEGNNDDDFWYGAPKGGAYEQPVGGGEYQSYIGNAKPANPSISGRQRKPPSANKRVK